MKNGYIDYPQMQTVPLFPLEMIEEACYLILRQKPQAWYTVYCKMAHINCINLN